MALLIIYFPGEITMGNAYSDNEKVNFDGSEISPYKPQHKTKCAVCGEHKETPIRNDKYGGYLCLACIDHILNIYEPNQEDPNKTLGDLLNFYEEMLLSLIRERINHNIEGLTHDDSESSVLGDFVIGAISGLHGKIDNLETRIDNLTMDDLV